MTDKEIMQQALDALLDIRLTDISSEQYAATVALRQAISEAETHTDVQVLAITAAYEQGVGKGRQRAISKNPYAAGTDHGTAWGYGFHEGKEMEVLVAHTSPPAREWVGLTDDEVATIVSYNTGYDLWCDGENVAKTVQVKLKELNHD